MQVKVSRYLLLPLLLLVGDSLSSGSSVAALSPGGLLKIKDVILDFIQRKPITLVTLYFCHNGEGARKVDKTKGGLLAFHYY